MPSEHDTNVAAPFHPTFRPSFRQASLVWARIGLTSFGGPAGQIALMHRELVEDRRWISEDRFLHALNFCMLLPGPEAQQLATYIGWLMHGVRGGIVAGVLFILPGLLVMLCLSTAYVLFQDALWLEGIFFGLKAAVLAIVVEAVLRVGRRALKTAFARTLAVTAFVALFLFNLPFPLVIAAAALAGYLSARLWPDRGRGRTAPQSEPERAALIDEGFEARASAPFSAILLWGGLWGAPFVLIVMLAGFQSVFIDIGLFFSKMAVVTFGGAYAVLSYVAQQAAETYHWLMPGEMVDGLALAETTPGPLVLVLSFVGFMGAYRGATGMDPLLAGLLGGLLAAWVTFIPCFLWIFLGAPFVEALRGSRVLSGALAAISAAVTGVILNLAVWFGLHVMFSQVERRRYGPLSVPLPELSSFAPLTLALTVLAAFLLFRARAGVVVTLAVCAAIGWMAHLFWLEPA